MKTREITLVIIFVIFNKNDGLRLKMKVFKFLRIQPSDSGNFEWPDHWKLKSLLIGHSLVKNAGHFLIHNSAPDQ